jgi:hypothetical protein
MRYLRELGSSRCTSPIDGKFWSQEAADIAC